MIARILFYFSAIMLSGDDFMKKKSKNKPKKLSEKDYENYIMQLKDERPTKCIVGGKTTLQNEPDDG
ncbi:MAG TPA: hypothetical protein DHU65_04770 [Clostridiales bacterium]|nr:hypothetical protein [Clostridiales bacterium]